MLTDNQEELVFDDFKPMSVLDTSSSTPKVYTAKYNIERKAYLKLAKKVENELTTSYKEMFKAYRLNLQQQKDVLGIEFEDNRKSKNYVMSQLEKYTDSIIKYTNKTPEDIFNCINANVFHGIKIKDEFLSKEHFLILWKSNIILNQKYYKLIFALETIQRRSVNYSTWFQIVSKFNDQVVDAMVKEGYELHMGYGVSSLRVRKYVREQPDRDNPKSYQNRNAILARGGIPYNKTTAPDGERWQVYRNSHFKYRFYWNKINVGIKGSYYHSYVPTGGEKGMILRLFNHLNNYPTHSVVFKH